MNRQPYKNARDLRARGLACGAAADFFFLDRGRSAVAIPIVLSTREFRDGHVAGRAASEREILVRKLDYRSVSRLHARALGPSAKTARHFSSIGKDRIQTTMNVDAAPAQSYDGRHRGRALCTWPAAGNASS